MATKIKIQITHWITGSVLFEYEGINNTLERTLKKAFKAGANLYGANLYGANLYGANLRGANLSGANLYGANLYGANLYGANLYGANLRGANLSGANLYGANLSGADLYGANLYGADLRGANNVNDDYTDFWWHLHHEVLVEQLTEPVRARINYIKKNKPKDEIELRLKLFKPVLGKIPKTDKDWEALHKRECGCGWNGKTIFTKENGLVK